MAGAFGTRGTARRRHGAVPAPGAIVAAPVNTVAPVISGTAQDGQTLTATDGTWTGSPTFTRQWYSNTVNSTTGPNVTAISGATAATLALTSALVGLYIFFKITGSNVQGSVTATSTVVGDVIAAAAGGTTVAAPTNLALASPTAYPPVVSTINWDPSQHIVGDTITVAVYPGISVTAGVVTPTGTPSVNTTITLSATAATNISNINGALAGIASGTGYLCIRDGSTGLWAVVQYGTASVPALSSSAAITAYETVALSTTITYAAPIKKLVIRGNDSQLVELVNAQPGTSFTMQWTGGGAKSKPLRDFTFDNVADIIFEATGFNNVTAQTTAAITLNTISATAFDFADITSVPLSGYGVSPTTVTVAGLPTGVSVPVTCTTGVQVSKDGGTTWFNSGLLSVQNGEGLNARVATPGTASRTIGTVTYGGKSDSFNADNVGYVAPVSYGWDATTGTGGSGTGDSSITVSGTNNRTATMTTAQGPRTMFGVSASARSSGIRFIQFTPNRVAGTDTYPGLIDTATGNVMYWANNGLKTDSGPWGAGGYSWAQGDVLGFEVNFTTQTIAIWKNAGGAGTWTKLTTDAFIASFGSSIKPWLNQGYATGCSETMETAPALPSGVASGCVAWGAA